MALWNRTLALARKELTQFLRDRLMLLIILFLYTVEALMCVYALSFDVRDLPTAVRDLDRSVASRQLVDHFERSGYFRIDHGVGRDEDLARLLDRGEVLAAIVVPPGFAERLVRGVPAPVQLILDGSNANTASVAKGYAERIVQDYAFEQRNAHDIPMVIEHHPRVWYNAELTYSHFVMLSMIAIAGMMVGVFTAAAGIVREKESGTIEQLLVTPVRPAELMAAKMAPPLLVGLLALFPSLFVAAMVGVPLRGSVTLFVMFSAVFLLSGMGIGILIATVTGTLQQALLVSFFVLFPVSFLSGTVVPLESMPTWLQYLMELSPLRHYMESILGLFLKGVGLEVLWPRLLAMVLIGTVLLSLAIRRWRRRIG
jgi:ABC-2 type transport system permease protein